MTKEERDEMIEIMKEAMKPLQDDISNIKRGQNLIQGEVQEIKKETAKIEGIEIETGKIVSIEEKITRLEITMENEVDRAIKVIGEGHIGLNRKIDEVIGLDSRVEILENKMSAVEFSIKNPK